MKLGKSDIYLPKVTKATFKKVGRKAYHIKKIKNKYKCENIFQIKPLL